MDAMFGLYVHWPFCKSKCPYCDFNSHVRASIDHERWREALLTELESTAAAIGPRSLNSIFFGGGTPSLMEPETAAAVIEKAKSLWKPADDLEITLEANPTSVEAEKFRGFARAGVNRVSLGIQSLNDEALRFLGREHSASEARGAIELAADTFDRHSFDLIYARPDQTEEQWLPELKTALDLAGEHLSLYQLTIEQGTAFFTKERRGDFTMPEEDDAATLYEVTQAVMEESGRPAYEISNHARPGAESRHNLIYWRYQDYAGIGPGAHGRVTVGDDQRAVVRARLPGKWVGEVEEKGAATSETFTVAPEPRLEEALMMGLRLTEGVPYARLDAECGGDWRNFVDQAKLGTLEEAGLLICKEDRLQPTRDGLQRLNAVLQYLLS